MSDRRGAFTPEQVKTLLNPIKPNRVLSVQGHSHVSQQDITAHLIRMFGFGNFDIEVLGASLVFEDQRSDAKTGALLPKWDVCYRAMVRITVRNPEGEHVATYENGSTATAQNQSRGDGHDLAYKSAISLSIKRAAIALGDQFGLSLYNKGQLAPLVINTLVGGTARGDIQDQVPQQLALGNDEVDPDLAGADKTTRSQQQITAAVAAVNAATTVEQLDTIEHDTWRSVRGVPAVRDALQKRRATLPASTVDAWAVAEPGAS
jgi:hypothetical protein